MPEPERVLIVDDQDLVLRTLDAILAVEHYRVEHAPDGPTALLRARAEPPDIILLDLMMPGMTGFEVCRRLRADPDTSQTPIIVLTALADRRVLVSALEAGADEFITKPVAGVELRARIRTMLRIRRQNVELQQLMLRRDMVTHMMVHDFRGPLSIISGAAEMLARDCATGARTAVHLGRIQEGVTRLGGLVDQILLIGKSESGLLAATKTQCSVSDLLLRVVESFEDSGRRRKIEMVNSFPAGVQAEVDADLLRRVVENLLSNAFKHAPPDSNVALSGGVSPASGDTAEMLEIRVSDQGPGIPRHLRQAVFDLYASTGLDEKGELGFGLGLPFCRMAARLHGGEVQVDDNVPSGATLTIRIPRVAPVLLQADAAAAGGAAPDPHRSREAELDIAIRRFQVFGPGASGIGDPAE